MQSPSFLSHCSGSSALPEGAPLGKLSARNSQEKLKRLCSAITSGKSGVGDIIISATHSKKKKEKKRVQAGKDPESVSANPVSGECCVNVKREGQM